MGNKRRRKRNKKGKKPIPIYPKIINGSIGKKKLKFFHLLLKNYSNQKKKPKHQKSKNGLKINVNLLQKIKKKKLLKLKTKLKNIFVQSHKLK